MHIPAKKLPIMMLVLIVFFSSDMHAASYTNKTFLSTRSPALYLPYESSFSHELPYHPYSLHLTPIYSHSTNTHDLARFFMFSCQPCQNIGRKTTDNTNIGVDHRHIKFDETNPTALNANLSFAPEVTNRQVWITYNQNFGQAGKGLFLTMHIPIVSSTYDLNACFGKETRSSDRQSYAHDFFCGNQMITGSRGCDGQQTCIALQEPLEWGKITGSCTKIGLADIHASIGYRPWISDRLIYALSFEIIMPTNSRPRSRELFEARLGTQGHWAIGLHEDLQALAWRSSSHKQALWLNAHARWLYLFKASERRILGLCSSRKRCLDWGHYQLIGHLGLPLVSPAANTLAQTVSITPGNQLELMASLRYTNNSWTITAGYDLWVKQKERICRQQTWCNGRYGFPSSSFAQELVTFGHDACPLNEYSPDLPEPLFSCAATTDDTTICSLSPQQNGSSIGSSHINLSPAVSPATNTHMIFATISRAWQWNGHRLTISLGGGYEHAGNNAALSEYSLWGTMGVLF